MPISELQKSSSENARNNKESIVNSDDAEVQEK